MEIQRQKKKKVLIGLDNSKAEILWSDRRRRRIKTKGMFLIKLHTSLVTLVLCFGVLVFRIPVHFTFVLTDLFIEHISDFTCTTSRSIPARLALAGIWCKTFTSIFTVPVTNH